MHKPPSSSLSKYRLGTQLHSPIHGPGFLSCVFLSPFPKPHARAGFLDIGKQVVQIAIIVPPASFPSRHDNALLLLLLLLGHGAQQLLELFFGDFLAQLAGSCERYQAVLDVGGA